MPSLGGALGDPDAAIGLSGLDHHELDLYHLNRFDPVRSSYHFAHHLGRHKAAQAPQASGPGVVEVLEAWWGFVDCTTDTSAQKRQRYS